MARVRSKKKPQVDFVKLPILTTRTQSALDTVAIRLKTDIERPSLPLEGPSLTWSETLLECSARTNHSFPLCLTS